MFNDFHITGTINIGNIAVAVINLISAIAIYYRIKAHIAEQEAKDKLPGGRRKDDPPIETQIKGKDDTMNVDK